MPNTHDVLTGICSCCLGRFVVQGQDPVLHGYKRPGDGYIMGRCWGENHVPFELSCNVAKDWLKNLVEKVMPMAQDRLVELQTPGLDTLVIRVADGYYPSQRWGHRETKFKLVTIAPGYVHVKNADNDYDAGTTFESYRKRAITAQKRYIEGTAREIEAVTEKIASWVYAPQKLQTREQVSAAKKQAQAEKAAKAKFLRNWKDAWKGVADAIRDHKQGYGAWEPARAEFYKNNPFPTDKERAAARGRSK